MPTSYPLGLRATLVVALALGLAACKDPDPASAPATNADPAPEKATPTDRQVTFRTARTDPARQGQPGDWCGGHALPESMCSKCNPELTEKFQRAGDWCEAHGYPESACPECNPWQPPAHRSQSTAAVLSFRMVRSE